MINFHHYLTFLNVLKYDNIDKFTYNCSYGKLYHSFIFILNGNAKYITKNKTLTIKSGDMIYIPKGQKYMSVYEGNHDISYCNVVCSFSPDFPEHNDAIKILPIQKLRYTNICTNSEIENLHKSFCSLQTSGIDTIIRFYSIYEKIFPYLESKITGKVVNRLKPATDYIERHIRENFKVEQLAELCFMSETYFFKLFKNNIGCTPIEYKNRIKIQRAMVMLSSRENTVAYISEFLGFSSDEYFTKTFKKIVGFTPSQFRKMQLSLRD